MGGPDAQRILTARALRAFGDGFVAILLPVHLGMRGFDAFAIGTITTSTLLGSALLTLLLGMLAHRARRRLLLVLGGALMAATGLGFFSLETYWPLLVVAFVGTINPSNVDVGVFVPIEHTVLAQSVTPKQRTALFARYAFVGTVVGALGALTAGVVDWAEGALPARIVVDGMFLLYAAIGLVNLAIYRGLSPLAEAPADAPASALGPSRGKVYRLAALFSLDAFAGGFVVNTLLALWLFERFGLSPGEAGAILFASGLCSSVSYFVAVRIAARIGLVRTMVFTHLPSHLLLIGAAFAPDVTLAASLLVLRGFLSQMDVPTRSSFVMAMVSPPERPAAASVTMVPRSLSSAISPALAGGLMGMGLLAAPLVIAGGMKVVYDLMLLRMFAKEKPPEEGG